MGFDISKVYTYKEDDELYTPSYAIKPLIKYLPKNSVIWECAERIGEEGNITKELRNEGFKVITTSIHNGEDFLTCEVPNGVNCIITNPPFSLKDDFIKRCYYLNLPWALLLPIGALQSIERAKMFKKHGVDLLVFDKRIKFINGGNSPSFATAWFTNKLLNSGIVFEELKNK